MRRRSVWYGLVTLGVVGMALIAWARAPKRATSSDAPASMTVDKQVKTSPKGSSATADEPAPVQVLVRKDVLGDGVLYNYRVLNGSPFPITSLRVGYDETLGLAEIPMPDDSTATGQEQSPAGWVFALEPTQDDSVGNMRWEITSQSSVVLGGGARSGFAVKVPQESGVLETGHWTVFLNNARAAFYVGTLEPMGATSVPPSSILGPQGVVVTPNPGRGVIEISFEMPVAGVVTVEMFDAQGRSVRRVTQEKLGPGTRGVVWDGKDDRGVRLPAGAYFVRIKTPKTERFARVVLVK